MANGKKKQKRRKRPMFGGVKVRMALLLGAAVGPANIIQEHKTNGGNFSETAGYGSSIYTGYNPTTRQFEIANMAEGILPAALGAIGSKMVGDGLGVNKMLADAKIPIFRI